MFQQAPRKERLKSATLSAPANMLSFRGVGGQGGGSSSSTNTLTGNSGNTSSSLSNTSFNTQSNATTANTNNSNNPQKPIHPNNHPEYIPTSAYVPTAPTPGPSAFSDIPNPTFHSMKTQHHHQQPGQSSAHHQKQASNASSLSTFSTANHNNSLIQSQPRSSTPTGPQSSSTHSSPRKVPQSKRAPRDPSGAPGVTFRSSLKPPTEASIPDIPYGAGQGTPPTTTGTSSVNASPTKKARQPSVTSSSGKARIFTPSDTQRGIRVTPQDPVENKRALQENTSRNAGAGETTTTVIASSAAPAAASTHLYTPSAPLTVNAPVVSASKQEMSTSIDTEALEGNLAAQQQAAATPSSSSNKQPAKSALKAPQARSWADLVRPMNHVKLAEHTLKNLGLPEKYQTQDASADVALAQLSGDYDAAKAVSDAAKKKRVSIALPAGSSAGQGSTATATPSKVGALAADKTPHHQSPPPESSTKTVEAEGQGEAGTTASTSAVNASSSTGPIAAEGQHDPASDTRSIRSTNTQATSIYDSISSHSKKAKLSEILRGVENSNSSVILYPRGLVNTGNACFMNAILQTLLFTAPFYNLISLIGNHTSQDLSGKTPLLDAMVSYMGEFRSSSANEKENQLKNNGGYEDEMSNRYRDAFIPSIIYHALNHNQRFAQMGFYNPAGSSSNSSTANGYTPSQKQHLRQGSGSNAPMSSSQINQNSNLSQEDAQEFLGFFLDTIHEELLTKIEQHDKQSWQKATKGAKAGMDILTRQSVNGISGLNHTPSTVGNVVPANDAASTIAATSHTQEDTDDWLEVGSKGRTATTRTTEHMESAITKIFGGQLRSVLKCQGQKDSVTLEPFMSLQLEIHPGIYSIMDALNQISTPETLNDVTNKQNIQVEATKQVFIETLPPVLILHLKRFNYDSRAGGVVKSHKTITYDLEFEIPDSIIAPSRRVSTFDLAEGKKINNNRYKLAGVVYHHGKSATGGHYTSSVKQANGRWINIDDTTITPVLATEVATDRDRERMALSLPSAANLRGVPEKSAYLLFYQRAH